MIDKWRYDLCSVKRQCEAQVYKFKNSETLHIVNGFEQYVAPNTTDVTGEIVSIIWIKYRKKKSSLAFTNIQNFPFKRDPWVCRHKKKVKYRRVMNGTRTPGDMTQGNIAIPICSCSYQFSIVHSMQQYVYTIVLLALYGFWWIPTSSSRLRPVPVECTRLSHPEAGALSSRKPTSSWDRSLSSRIHRTLWRACPRRGWRC